VILYSVQVGIQYLALLSEGHLQGCGLEISVSKSTVLVSHSWSWQSAADLGVVRPVSVLNFKFHHHKLNHIVITCYSKLTAEGHGDYTCGYHCCLCIDILRVFLRFGSLGLDRGLF